ncbi:unnamed protein product, partial [Polarella glacialis]
VNFTWPWTYSSEHLERARCRLKGADVLFMSTWSGSEWQHSYTMRASQVAKGLRRILGIEARVCMSSCTGCCAKLKQCASEGRCRVPSVVVHIKGVCDCVVASFPRSEGVVHVLDPIDSYVLTPPLSSEDDAETSQTYRGISAILAETSLSAADYRSHPSVRSFGWQVFHLPHHHTNLARRTIACDEKADARVVGVHSTQIDPNLEADVKNMLASRFPAVRFQRVNPSNLSGKSAEWSPNPVLWNDAKVGRMLDELLAFDVTIMKPNCYTPGDKETHVHQRWRSWLCERHHSGQRLVHALAAGLPSVVWGASQGFVDAVGPSEVWPTAWNNSEVLHHLEELLSNGTLRCSLSAEARRLAEPYHISKTVERYALAFAALLEASSRVPAKQSS